MVKTTPFDAAEFLDTPEIIADYLTEAFREGDARFIAGDRNGCARSRYGRGGEIARKYAAEFR
jgi:DNA-binding phage protein